MGFIIEDHEVRSALNWDLVLDSARRVFRAQEEGRVFLTDPRIQRLRLPTASSHATAGYRIKGAVFTAEQIAGVRIAGSIILSRWPEMEFLGVVEERTGYTHRVGAVTAVALEMFGQECFAGLCLFGAGRLATTTLEALLHRYDVGPIRVIARSAKSAHCFVESFRGRELDVAVGIDVREAVRSAELIVTMTNADEVLLHHDWVRPDHIIVSMGGGQELDLALLEHNGALIVDDLEGCLESGDLQRLDQADRYHPALVSGSIFEYLGCAARAEHHIARPTVLIPRGMASMDVMQAIEIAKTLGYIPTRGQ